MVAIGLMFYGFVVQPVMSYGTVILFLYGLIASFVGHIRHKEYVWIYVLRLLVCFTIPVTNLLMYFATIGGDARKFDFRPMPLVYYLVFILEIMIIFLPEIFLLIEKKRSIKRKQWIYTGAIVGVSVLFWCTI
ncbi:hypothetical protein RA177_17795 [Bacillus safensis]|uniref:hypothetical protein n=1 Tax=Bacillus safensis TaxID=561879 RepID=UPI0027BA42CD|nr:hypothetical protein [Bacillus safensis]WLW69377.1 hypothetical protein RA177_17795 [Bacillus safensis]